ncbi:MAG: MurR/RpiR family transcriptional regulator [Chloroflexi bacterium]|nr:MurR/RpiR family transcriptional regulator [Chloroflexota bacterium]
MFQEQIRQYYDSLTPGFRKLADFIMDHTLDAAFLTVTEISRRVGVDPATVVRFAQEIGYSGYRELSHEIKHYVRDQVTTTYRKSVEAESEEALVHQLLDSTRQNLADFSMTETAKLGEALRILKQAPRVWITGEGPQQAIAQFLARMLQVADIQARAFAPDMLNVAAALSKMEPGEALLVLAISVPDIDSGYLVRMAREKGVHTITIADNTLGAPAHEAELVVLVPTAGETGIPNTGAALAIIALIWEALAGTTAAKTAESFAAYNEYLSEILELRTHTAAYEAILPQTKD